jgi:hypothetical protein
MEKQEFLDLLKKWGFTPDNYYDDFETIDSDYDWDEEEDKGEVDIEKLKEIFGEWKEVDAYGGEGDGDTHYRVLYFPKYDFYIKADGWYASYDGAHYEDSDWYFVTPKEKTVVVYERVD